MVPTLAIVFITFATSDAMLEIVIFAAIVFS